MEAIAARYCDQPRSGDDGERHVGCELPRVRGAARAGRRGAGRASGIRSDARRGAHVRRAHAALRSHVRGRLRARSRPAIAAALTSRTKLIVITHPHNPTGVAAERSALDEIGRIAERAGAHVLVDEVYKDVASATTVVPAAERDDVFITTSSLTKSYGLSSLRVRLGHRLDGSDLSPPARARHRRRHRVDRRRAAGDVLAFEQLDALCVARARDPRAQQGRWSETFLASRRSSSGSPSAGNGRVSAHQGRRRRRARSSIG